MKATRRTQPYKAKGPARPAGPSLAAMLRGRTASGQNPQDAKRGLQKLVGARGHNSSTPEKESGSLTISPKVKRQIKKQGIGSRGRTRRVRA